MISMRKFFVVLFILNLFGCNKAVNIDESESTKNSIVALHQRIDSVETDIKYPLIEKAKLIIENNATLHDTIKAEQDYLTGVYFAGKGNLDSASIYFQNATNYIKKGPLVKRHLNYFYWAWDTYLDKEEYGECIAINQKFKSLVKENNDDRLNSIAHSLDKNIYLKTKEFRKALESSSKQIAHLKKTGDTADIVSALISRTKILDDVYNDRAEVFKLLDSLTLYSKDYTPGINRLLYGQYGVHLFNEERYAEARDYYEQGLVFAKKIENPTTRRKRTSNIYNNLAEVCLELNRHEDAKAYLDTVYQMDIATLERRQQRAYLRHQLRLTANTNQDINKVLTVLDSLNTYQNRTYEEKYTKDLTALKIANENEKKLLSEKQEAEFKNFRLQAIMVIGLITAVLLALIGSLFYRQKKYSLERENLLTQQRLLRAQMNPHFTFNTLSVIGEMIDQSPRNAKNHLVKFSRLLASIFENSTFNYVLLEKELDALKEYMDLQKIRIKNGFNYEIEMNDVEPDLVYVPGMLLQPIIENSINHGFSGIDYSGQIKIHLNFQENLIHCEIEDNGKGLVNSSNSTKRTSSTQLISAFIEKITKTKFEVIDKKDTFEGVTGVIVKFSIPYKESMDD